MHPTGYPPTTTNRYNNMIALPVGVPPPPATALAAAANHKPKRLCRFPGCTKTIKSQGHCQRHGARSKRCRVDGCEKQAQGTHDGMCKRHWKVSILFVDCTETSLSCSTIFLCTLYTCTIWLTYWLSFVYLLSRFCFFLTLYYTLHNRHTTCLRKKRLPNPKSLNRWENPHTIHSCLDPLPTVLPTAMQPMVRQIPNSCPWWQPSRKEPKPRKRDGIAMPNVPLVDFRRWKTCPITWNHGRNNL